MSQSDEELVEVFAQLLHRLKEYEKRAPWMFRVIKVEDAAQEAFLRFLNAKVSKGVERIATVPLLKVTAHGVIVDVFRKTKREGLTEEIPPELLRYNEKPWLKIMIDRIIENAAIRDRPYWKAFRRLAEGPSLSVLNQEVAEALNVSAKDVVLFKKRARRTRWGRGE